MACYDLTTRKGACYLVETRLGKGCFTAEVVYDEELPFPPPEIEIPGFSEIWHIQARGTGELIVTGRHKETETSPEIDTIARVSYIESVELGGIGYIFGVIYKKKLSTYGLTVEQITRLDGFDVLSFTSNICIVADTRVIWLGSAFFSVEGDTDEFTTVLGEPSLNPYSKETTYPSNTTFTKSLPATFTVSGGYSSYRVPQDEAGECSTGTYIGPSNACGPIICGPKSETVENRTTSTAQRKTYNIGDGSESSSAEEASFKETEDYDGGWMCQGYRRVPSFSGTTYCSHSGTQITGGGGNIIMQREDIVSVMGDGNVHLGLSFTISLVWAEYESWQGGGGSESCVCGENKSYKWACEELASTANDGDDIVIGFNTAEPIFKLSVGEDIVSGVNGSQLVWAKKDGSEKGTESISGKDSTVIGLVFIEADGTDKLKQKVLGAVQP